MRVLRRLLLLLCLAPAVAADEIRPALLEVVERPGGWVDVTWKVPMRGDRKLAAELLGRGRASGSGPARGPGGRFWRPC